MKTNVIYTLPDYKEVTPSETTTKNFLDARINIVKGSAIFAYALVKCEYIFTNDIDTAGACIHDDRNIIYINPEWFDTKLVNAKQRAFVLLHELEHIFLGHQQRCIIGGLDHGIYNKAADYYINLRASGVYLDGDGNRRVYDKYTINFEMPEGEAKGLYDERFLGKSTEEIYHILVEEGSKESGEQVVAVGFGGEGLDIMGNGGTPQQANRNAQAMIAAVTFAQQSNGIGDCEGDLVKSILDMAKPKVDWTSKVMNLVQTSVRARPTYNRISNRSSSTGDGVIFPTYTGEHLNIVFGVDSSGSMGESDYRRALGELSGIIETFESWKVHFVCCDMALYEMGVYSSVDGDTISSVNTEFRGLGGTDMSPIAKYAGDLLESGEEVVACIILTDGGIYEHPLDSSFHEQLTNIVVSTRKTSITLKNAELIVVDD